MLIELQDPSSGDNELFDSIWSTVERANGLSLDRNQLQKDYITFSEPDKPFLRTDKGTVQRRATLTLYADYIERFYASRLENLDARFSVTIDTSSVESIMDAMRHIFGSLSPAFQTVSPDTDMFSLGLDSLVVFQIIKAIQAATHLHDRLAPRHLYANPTLAKFSAAIAQLVTEAKKTNGRGSDDPVDGNLAKVKKLMDKHRSRLSQKMNPFDLTVNFYVGTNFFFPLRKGVSFAQAFARLQQGLRRAMELIPELEGKVIACSEQEIGYKKGDLRITLPPLPSTATSDSDSTSSSTGPKQLVYKDVSQILPSFEELRDAGFISSALKDDLLLDGLPTPPSDVFNAQANFVEGGCIVVANFHHTCVDGYGAVTAVRVWAESCRYVQGDTSATCSWLDPESLNRSLPYILYEQEGYARPAHEVDPATWGYVVFPPPKELGNGNGNGNGTAKAGALATKPVLPPSLTVPRDFFWQPAPDEGPRLRSTTFLIPPENVQKLRQEVVADSEIEGAITSINDIVQAFFWRAAIKARYRVATERHGEIFGPDDMSILELAIDARPYFSSLLPSSYMGNMFVRNWSHMPVKTLCSSEISVGRVACLIREAAARITPSLVHDVFTLLQSVPDYTMCNSAAVGLTGMHASLTNMLLFPTSEVSFGSEFFANGGSPDTMRPQIERFSTNFRLLVILPMREDGGVELLLGTLPEEFEMLTTDEEFTRYAKLMG